MFTSCGVDWGSTLGLPGDWGQAHLTQPQGATSSHTDTTHNLKVPLALTQTPHTTSRCHQLSHRHLTQPQGVTSCHTDTSHNLKVSLALTQTPHTTSRWSHTLSLFSMSFFLSSVASLPQVSRVNPGSQAETLVRPHELYQHIKKLEYQIINPLAVGVALVYRIAIFCSPLS